MQAYQSKIRALFATDPQEVWMGGTPGKVGDDPTKMYVAIQEDQDWGKNKCILRDWYFNYAEFEKLGLGLDCEDYGVYVFSLKKLTEKS
jgi:hypothetical protein